PNGPTRMRAIRALPVHRRATGARSRARKVGRGNGSIAGEADWYGPMEGRMSNFRWLAVLPVALVAGMAAGASAEVRPNPIFTDGVVLQRGMPVPVWGTAKTGERVTVRFQGQTVSATPRDGKWIVRLRPLKEGP